MADGTRDPKIIAVAQRKVTLTDSVFTAGGIVLLIVGGVGAYTVGGLAPATPWIVRGTGIFAASGFIRFLIVIPVQTRLARLSRDFASAGEDFNIPAAAPRNLMRSVVWCRPSPESFPLPA